jgi:hypothetical protein
MDPLAMANAYATIVGLICLFKGERRAKSEQDRQHFLAWLETQHRQDLKELIDRTAELPAEIDKLLKQDIKMIVASLNELRDAVVSLPSRIDYLADILQSDQPRSERLRLLPQLIAETERAVRQSEKRGLFLLRAETDKDWDVPLDVDSLREGFEYFRAMDLADTLDHTFLVGQDAFTQRTLTVHIEGRLAEREKLLKAMQKLITLRNEWDYLEQETRIRLP